MKKKIFVSFIALILSMMYSVSAFASAKVVAVMYHNISPQPEKWTDFCVSPDVLDSDIKYFTARGYIPITASELANESMANLEGKKILLLTFDDGYESFYSYVYPILRQNNAKGTMYIVGSHINRYGFVTSDMLYEMAHCGFIEIGNHTNMLHQLPKTTLASIYSNAMVYPEAMLDIKDNGEYIESIIQKKVTAMSWPYGQYTDNLDQMVKNQLGYCSTVSTNYGVNYYNGNNSIILNRINREASTTSQSLYERAEGMFK